MATGQWRAFQQRRDELKAQGASPHDARVVALREVMPEGYDDGDTVAAEGGALALAPPELAGRTADEPAIVRWVARNVDGEADPATCPDPFAWTLLRECRETPGFVADHFLPLWAKLIPPRSQLEQAGPKVQDGQPVIELIDRIVGHARKARESAAETG